MSVILTVANNTSGVSRGLHKPNFTLNVKELDTRDKVLHVESAQFEVHFENIDEATNKLYVVHGVEEEEEEEDRLSIKTGTYSDVDDLVSIINATLKRAGHGDIVFSYSRHTSRISVSVPRNKRCLLKKDSPALVLGVGTILKPYTIEGSHTFPFAVDLTKGRRLVLLYTDLIGPAVEYEDNTDSRVLKTFLIQTLNGLNNYVFGKEDKRLLLPHENVTSISFWLKFNTGEHITSGYPVYIDLRITNTTT